MRYLTIYKIYRVKRFEPRSQTQPTFKIYCLATKVLYTHHVVLLQSRLLNYIAKPKRQFTSAFFSCL